jgi:adenylate cyclase
VFAGGDHELLGPLRRKLSVALPSANLLGAVAVFSYLMLTLGPPAEGVTKSIWPEVGVFAVLLSVLLAVGTYRCTRQISGAVCWLSERPEPTAEEREATLRLPGRLAAEGFVLWVVAAAFYTASTLVVTQHSVDHALRVAVGIGLGGVLTSAVAYLLLERAFRPVFAVTLAGEAASRPRTLGVRPRLLLAWAAGSAVPLLGLALSPMAWEEGARVSQTTGVALLAWLGLTTGAAATFLASRTVAEPLDRVREGLRQVEAGDLSAHLPVDDAGEVGMVQAGFNRMVAGLRERERLRDLFGRHVGDEVAHHALEMGTGLGGEQREASVLFVDLVGSTAMTEVLSPEEVVATLNVLFGATVRVVGDEGGWVNKFEGDGAMCVFGAPGVQPNHAARALRAARRLHAVLQTEAAAHPGLDVGIGVSSGVVVAGNVGAEQRYEYTVIGGPVNEAARLSDVAKGRPDRVLASQAALQQAREEAGAWISTGHVALRGRSTPTELFAPGRALSGARRPAQAEPEEPPATS